jgi:hypothetical protein
VDRFGLFFVLISWGAPVAASAQERVGVVSMLDEARTATALDALAIELSASGAVAMVAPPPLGDTALERAASAQATARSIGARAAIWIEAEPLGGAESVRVVGAEGEWIRHAPLVAGADARTLAVVAASLVRELLDPPAAPVNVRVEVHIDAPGREVEVHEPGSATLLAPPAAVPAPSPATLPIVVAGTTTVPVVDQTSVEPDDNLPRLPRDGFVLSLGPTFAGIYAGGEVGLGLYLTEDFRLDATGMLGAVLSKGDPIGMAGLRLSRIGNAHRARFDYGIGGGLILGEDKGIPSTCPSTPMVSFGDDGASSPDTTSCRRTVEGEDVVMGYTAGAHFGFGWEFSRSLGLVLRGHALVAKLDREDPIPAGFLSATLELPL